MFWEDYNEPSFYKHICQPENFLYLDEKNVIYLRVAEIVMSYVEPDENIFGKLKRKLIENQKMFQHVYARIYPEVDSFVEKRGVYMRNNFHLKFKEWKDRKTYSQKSIDGYFSKPQNSPPPEGVAQKKLVTDVDFEEDNKNCGRTKTKRDGREKTQKRERRREVAAKNKELKWIKEGEKNKQYKKSNVGEA